MSKMYNYSLLIKPEETETDIIAEICDDLHIGPDELFAFSAIMVPEQDADTYKLKVNYFLVQDENYYTPKTLIKSLLNRNRTKQELKSNAQYVQPPLEQWLQSFKPLLSTMADRAHKLYCKTIPDRDDIFGTLYLVTTRLYRQGYYLSKNLIWRSLLNELNTEIRKSKHHINDVSLSQSLGEEQDGTPLTLEDQIVDPNSIIETEQLCKYTIKDFWEDKFNEVKERMLQDMSQLSFYRILMQLEYKCIDTKTSQTLSKYREIFNPNTRLRKPRKPER